VAALYPVTIRVHWWDTDAAGIVWFGNFFRFFEEAEDELFRALGRARTDLVRDHRIFMPRVETSCRFRSPVRAGDLIEVGIGVDEISNRRIQYRFVVRDQATRRLIVEGSYRVACVSSETFAPQDFPAEIPALLQRLDQLAGVTSDGRHGASHQEAARHD
jgi:acyl-CoA thioester hydrolase